MTRHKLSGELFVDEEEMLTVGYDSVTYVPNMISRYLEHLRSTTKRTHR